MITIIDLCKELQDSHNKVAFFHNEPTSPKFFEPFYASGVLNFTKYATPNIVKYIVRVWDDIDKSKVIDLLRYNFNNRQSEFSSWEVEPILDKLSLEDIEQIDLPNFYFTEAKWLAAYLVKRFVKPKEEVLQKAINRINKIVELS